MARSSQSPDVAVIAPTSSRLSLQDYYYDDDNFEYDDEDDIDKEGDDADLTVAN
jgi:hypothetical protein